MLESVGVKGRRIAWSELVLELNKGVSEADKANDEALAELIADAGYHIEMNGPVATITLIKDEEDDAAA